MKKILLGALIASSLISTCEAFTFWRKKEPVPTFKQKVYVKTKSLFSHRVTQALGCAAFGAFLALRYKDYEKTLGKKNIIQGI